MNRSTVFLLLLLLFFCFIIGACGGCKSPNTNEPRAKVETSESLLRVGIIKGELFSLPLLVALEKEFFKEAGIDIEKPQQFDSQDDLLQSLLTGKIDIGFVDPVKAVIAIAKGHKICLVASVAKQGCSLVVHDGEVTKPLELPGMGIAIENKDTFCAFFLHQFLVKQKLDGQVYIVTFPQSEMYANHHKRYINGFAAVEPYIAKAIVNDNTGIMIDARKLLPNHPSSVLGVNPLFLKSNKTMVDKYLSALEKGMKYISSNPAESATIALNHLKIDLNTYNSSMSRILFSTELNSAHLEQYAEFINEMGFAKIENPARFIKEFSGDSI